MKILWICGLPYEVQEQALGGENHGAYAAWSWIMGHLPPPPDVELHIACRTSRHTTYCQIEYRGATFHLVPVKARARAFCLFQFDERYFRSLAKRLDPDIVHGWGTEDAYARVALRLAPNHHLVQIQGCVNACRSRSRMPLVTWFAARSERAVLAKARHVVAENPFALAAAQSMTRTDSLHVMEHPVRSAFLEAEPARGDARQILFVGAIEERKGVFDALEAFSQAAPDDWTFLVIGNGPAETVKELNRRIASPRFAGRVRYVVSLTPEEMVTRMQAASVFLLPTWVDTGPTTLKEALVMGLWPVCYDNTGPRYYLRHFQCGSLAEDRNVAALADSLRQVISTKPWLERAHGEKVLQVIRPHFDRVKLWPMLLNLYETIIRSQPGPRANRSGNNERSSNAVQQQLT